MQIRLGLKENRNQFILLVLINAFVGGMIGMERSILPFIAEDEFGITAQTAILSFITVFGIVKAVSNYYTGKLVTLAGRKNLLLTGWIFAIPVPFLLMFSDSWTWIVLANVFLGISQGLSWSSAVMMKIDLVGEENRGLAMGINEFSGYIAIAIVAGLTGWIASAYGLRPYPFYTGIILCILGIICTLFFLRDTTRHVELEATSSSHPRLANIFRETTFTHPNLSSVTQAGLINNLNDGMVWGLLPVVLTQKGFDLTETAMIVTIYPAVWGIGQLFTGKLSDLLCKKSLLIWGMMLQGIALLLLVFASTLLHFVVLSVILGLGTAMVYPTFLAAIAENTHPYDRPESLGTFRFWRDCGYAVSGLLTGLLADVFNVEASILIIACLTILSGVIIRQRMYCTFSATKVSEWLISLFR